MDLALLGNSNLIKIKFAVQFNTMVKENIHQNYFLPTDLLKMSYLHVFGFHFTFTGQASQRGVLRF